MFISGLFTNMTILTDVDGVLLSWNDRFHRWMRSKGFVPKHDESYSLAECYRMREEKIGEFVDTFNSSAEMGFLQPMGDSRYWVKHLHNKYGVNFHAITSMGTDYFARRLRRRNLQEIFGKTVFERITILPCCADKTEALMPYKDTKMFWLEDNIHNAIVGANLGLRSYLFNRSYNQNECVDEPFIRVNSWEQFMKNFRVIYDPKV